LTASPATTVVTVNIIAISNLNAINSGPTTSGQTTYLTATADGSNIGYTWDFGDGSTNSGATVSHNYAQPGLYSAMVTATNGAGSITATTTVSITPIVVSCTPLSYITVTGSITGMIDTLQPFTATVAPLTATLPMTVTWQAAGQQSVVTQTTLYTSFISYAWPVIGQRVITATAANGCSEVNATMVIAIQREYRFYMPMILR
jgi:PKD repeat protein